MNRNKYLFLLLALAGACAQSCNDDDDNDGCSKSSSPGWGGSAKVSGLVKHHSMLIPNAKVFIKFGATEFPGTDTTVYNAVAQADTTAHYEFNGLTTGDFYLYSVGYDSSMAEKVDGGIPVEICEGVDNIQTNVPVTEDH